MEVGEILSVDIRPTKADEEEVLTTINIPPPSLISGMKENTSEGSTTSGGSWVGMVKHNKVEQQYYSLEQMPSQSSQEMQDAT